MTAEEAPDGPDSTATTGVTAPDEGNDTPGQGDGTGGQGDDGRGYRGVAAYLEWGAIAGLGLVALIAVFRFYFAASRAISVWISPDFEPVFQAAFNLVVLLLAATGIVVFVRRRR